MRRIPLLLMCAVLLAATSQCSAQIIFHKKKKVDKSTAASNTAEPDKLLYDKAMADIKRGRHEVGRLGLQTLINTYPDSEYLAKAKLAIADSYFKEGGTANITQAIAAYKDFGVFFPFLPEAGYAQMQVAMANYNQMPKADRDNTHTKAAEEEFQTFLQKFPKDPLVPTAEQHLREVQEVLAEGQYRIGYYYYVKGDRRAAAGRLIPLVKRYPLYSKSDTALWMLGEIFEKSERKDIAGNYYGQIVRNYPLSNRAGAAKDKLKDFKMPIPQPDPKAVAWMTAEQNTPRKRESLAHKPLALFHPGPDVRMAAAHGSPNLEPESESTAGIDILRGGGQTNLGTGSGKTGLVLTVKPGEPTPAGSAPAGTTEDINSSSAGEPATGTAAASSSDPQSNADSTAAGTAPADGSSSADASKTDSTQPAAPSDDKNKKESSSKKKGFKRILPW